MLEADSRRDGPVPGRGIRWMPPTERPGIIQNKRESRAIRMKYAMLAESLSQKTSSGVNSVLFGAATWGAG